MEKFLMAIIALVACFVFAAAVEAGPFRNRGGYQAQCEGGVCAVLQQPTPAPVAAHAAPHAEACANAQGPVKSVLVAPARGVVKVAAGAKHIAETAVRGTAKAGKWVGGKVVKVGRIVLPPYGR